MNDLESCTPTELAIIATIIGVVVAKKLNSNQQNVIGNFLEGVGQTILVINAQIQNLQSQQGNQSQNSSGNNSSSNSKDTQKEIKELKEQIKKLEEKINC